VTRFRLDHGEAFNAAIAGLQRRFRAIQRQATNNQKEIINDEFATDIHGAIAEATVAKVLGLYCNLSSSDRAIADVGHNVEVRSSTRLTAAMPIRPRDKDDYKYYFVVGIYPDLRIVGWQWGRVCKQDKYYVSKDRNGQTLKTPYWSVPQSDLIHELIHVEIDELI